MCSDDELVILYLDINNNICNKHSHQQFSLIQHIEQIYESESDTDVGDFLNNITVLLLNHFNNIDLYYKPLKCLHCRFKKNIEAL